MEQRGDVKVNGGPAGVAAAVSAALAAPSPPAVARTATSDVIAALIGEESPPRS